MFYYVYKITNKSNEKVYIGKRCHKIPEKDHYMGSGSQIKSAIKKYGKENFKKEILQIFNTNDEAAAFESSLVTKEFVESSLSYNMHEGGHGGFAHINNNDTYLEVKRRGGRNSPIGKRLAVYKSSGRFKKDDTRTLLNAKKGGLSITESGKKSISNKNSGSGNGNFGKVWCIEKSTLDISKRKMFRVIPDGWISLKEFKLNQKCRTNPQFGKHWYNDGSKNFLLLDSEAKKNKLTRGRITVNN